MDKNHLKYFISMRREVPRSQGSLQVKVDGVGGGERPRERVGASFTKGSASPLALRRARKGVCVCTRARVHA